MCSEYQICCSFLCGIMEPNASRYVAYPVWWEDVQCTENKYHGGKEDIAEVKQKRYFRYICSGFSLIEFYLVTVLEKANVTLPPLQVITMVINTINVVLLVITSIPLWLLSQLKILRRPCFLWSGAFSFPSSPPTYFWGAYLHRKFQESSTVFTFP